LYFNNLIQKFHMRLFTVVIAVLMILACHPKAVPTADTSNAPSYEQHRPRLHFTPKTQWMNDPNGMFYYDGSYHLFYQHYPDSNVWGPMHWGHAVSKDLVQWQHLPIALYPDQLGYIFSGSAVVDWQNTSGLGKDGQPPVVAIFTYHDMEGEKAGRSDFQYQGIAYSQDKGLHWQKYAGNPVIPNTQKIRDFRDPKVIWHAPSKQWIMVFAAQNHVKFWASDNLKQWRHLSDFGQHNGSHAGVWECPDLFPIPLEGTKETKWVLLVSINPGAPNGGSGTQYFSGQFDGQQFVPDAECAAATRNGQGIWLDYGRDNYAGVSWSDIPSSDGRRLFMGWMSNWDYAQIVPTSVWRSAMTLPRVLTLHKTPSGDRLFSQPVQELAKRRGKSETLSNVELSGQKAIQLSSACYEVILEAEIPAGTSPDFGIEWRNDKGEFYRLGYDAQNGRYYSDRTKTGKIEFSEKFAQSIHTAPRIVKGNTIQMRIILDVASAELFADQGASCMTDIFFPNQDFSHLYLFSNKGKVRLKSCKIYAL
jgi:fructan beta-fructosidase